MGKIRDDGQLESRERIAGDVDTKWIADVYEEDGRLKAKAKRRTAAVFRCVLPASDTRLPKGLMVV